MYRTIGVALNGCRYIRRNNALEIHWIECNNIKGYTPLLTQIPRYSH